MIKSSQIGVCVDFGRNIVISLKNLQFKTSLLYFLIGLQPTVTARIPMLSRVQSLSTYTVPHIPKQRPDYSVDVHALVVLQHLPSAIESMHRPLSLVSPRILREKRAIVTDLITVPCLFFVEHGEVR